MSTGWYMTSPVNLLQPLSGNDVFTKNNLELSITVILQGLLIWGGHTMDFAKYFRVHGRFSGKIRSFGSSGYWPAVGALMEGICRGLELVRTNLGLMIVMGVILVLALGFIASFAIGLPFLFIMGPLLFGAIVGSDEFLGIGFVVSMVCFCLYLSVVILLGGVLRAYISSAWTLTYLRLTRGQPLLNTLSVPH